MVEKKNEKTKQNKTLTLHAVDTHELEQVVALALGVMFEPPDFYKFFIGLEHLTTLQENIDRASQVKRNRCS